MDNERPLERRLFDQPEPRDDLHRLFERYRHFEACKGCTDAPVDAPTERDV